MGKIYEILGISRTDVVKLLSELKFVHLIEIMDFENLVWIPDKERTEKFINYVSVKSFLKPDEKIEKKLTNIDEKTLQYFDQLYKLLTRSQEGFFAFVPEPNS